MEWNTVSAFLETRSVRSWPTAEGRIVSSEVSWKSLRAEPAIVYEYEANGKTFRSSKIRPRGYGKGEANELVNRYPSGWAATVFYDPNDPNIGYLEADLDFASYVIIITPLIFVGFGLAHFASLLRRPKREDSPEADRALNLDDSHLA